MTDAKILAVIDKMRAAPRPPHALAGGKGAKLHPRSVPVRSLLAGAKVELEHTRSVRRAVEIALDHIAEDRAYYSKLRRVHREAPRGPKRRTKRPMVVLGRVV